MVQTDNLCMIAHSCASADLLLCQWLVLTLLGWVYAAEDEHIQQPEDCQDLHPKCKEWAGMGETHVLLHCQAAVHDTNATSHTSVNMQQPVNMRRRVQGEPR